MVTLGLAGVFALAWYGIHRRYLATWWLGCLVFFASLGDFLYQALPFAFGLPDGQRWLLLGGTALIVLLVFGYWGFWWKSQKAYFHATPSI